MKRVGIYSGVFDPIHNGHLAFAEAATVECGLEKVFFLVEPSPRRKQAVKALEHRLRMTELAIAKQPKLGLIVLDQQQFTVQDTLPVLQRRFSGVGLEFLMGEDTLTHFIDWPNVEHLLHEVEFIIGIRDKSAQEISQTVRAIETARSMHFRYRIIQTPSSHVSSTAVRRQLRVGKTPEDIPVPVARYIKQYKLYTPVK